MIALSRQINLWHLVSGPAIWAAYFLTVYISAAIFCAKLAGESNFLSLRLFVGAATAVALAAIAIAGWRAFSSWRGAAATGQHADADTTEDPRRFLARTTLMLCGLSTVATLYSGLPALFIESCR